MFADLPAHNAPDDALRSLADAMIDREASNSSDNLHVPAGFTYLGKFVEHDLTLDCAPASSRTCDRGMPSGMRTPRLNLDSLYGGGPDGSPHLYARNPQDANRPGPKLLVGATIRAFQNFGNVAAGLPNDLPRNSQGLALIGDPRNDENLAIAQTHLALLKFHNEIVERLQQMGTPAHQLFARARQLATWHYQWVVLYDFVERITETGIVEKILREGRRFYRFGNATFLPVEFSAAAFCLRDSMARDAYSHNRVFSPNAEPPVPATLGRLFTFSGLSGIVGELAPDPPIAPAPVRLLTSNWVIDWRRFYDFHTQAEPHFHFNHSRRIDPFIAGALNDLPGSDGNLALRNLRQGVHLELPCGQDVANAMKIPALTPGEIATGPDGAVAKQYGLHTHTPLWYYILKEALVRTGGERLGPLGARIVAEVFVGLLQADRESFLAQPQGWIPTLPGKTPGSFSMTDLLQVVGDISPVDGITTVATL